jgi:hypothetical protein
MRMPVARLAVPKRTSGTAVEVMACASALAAAIALGGGASSAGGSADRVSVEHDATPNTVTTMAAAAMISGQTDAGAALSGLCSGTERDVHSFVLLNLMGVSSGL